MEPAQPSTGRAAIVALAPNPWHGQWVNRQQLLSRLGRMHDVVYTQGALSVWDRGTPSWRSAPLAGDFEPTDGILLDRPGRALPRWPAVPAWDRLAIAAHARRLRARRRPGQRSIAYVCHPMFWPYVRALRCEHVVYHCYDWYARQPGWTAELEAAQTELLRVADLAFTPTALLSDVLQPDATCDVRVLPNGADVQAFFAARAAAAPAPDDLARIPHPRIGYIGSLHPELDLDLIAGLARRRPDWHFVLIGPEQNRPALHALPGYLALQAAPNVHLLGARHRTQVPGYLLHMDVNVMFYRAASGSSWTEVAYPLKLHEYLACGQPVVSVELPMIREFAGLVTFAQGMDAWEEALQRAICEDDDPLREQRRSVAARHSWDSRVQTLATWLDELPHRQAGNPAPGATVGRRA
jgi:glycosyltransferase involved in cell wall biosynthesis